jgi:Domain of unknown function (DUF4307)
VSLDARYGRRPPSPARRRRLLAAFALFVFVAVAWAVWAAIRITQSTLTWADTGADASDPALVRVSFVVSLAPGREAVCAVRATDGSGAVVGWVDVPVTAPSSGAGLVRVTKTAPVPTSQSATGGGVSACAGR